MGILIWIGATVAAFGFAETAFNDMSNNYIGFGLLAVGFACLLVTVVESAEEWQRWRNKRSED